MDRLRIGVIGLGWFGEIHCEAIVGVPNLELAALCTRTPRAGSPRWRKKFGVKKTYRRLPRAARRPGHRRRVDRARCGTSTPSRPSPRSKPASTSSWKSRWPSTVADCQKIIAASKGAKGILQVGHICRFNPRYRMAKQAIAAGRIGKIVSLASRRNIPAAWTPTILNKIGPIVGDAIHDTDLMLWFTGDRVVSAYAQTVDVRGLKHPDIGQTMYRFAGGATATLETVWCMPEKTPFDIDERMTIIGTEGFIHDPGHVPESRHRRRGTSSHSPDTTYWPMFDGVRGGALREEFSYFASCALEGRAPEIGTPEDAMAALEATLAAEESARTGEVVRIGQNAT